MPSQAFNQTEQELTISAPLRWIGTFNEPKPATRVGPILTESAKGIGSGASAPKPQKSNSALWFVVGLFFLIASGIILAKLLLN